jgi:hypothetical protein
MDGGLVLQPYAIIHAEFRQLALAMIQQEDGRCAKIAGWPVERKLQHMLETLRTDAEYATEYTRFVQGMSYAAGGVPKYDEAMARLREVVNCLF